MEDFKKDKKDYFQATPSNLQQYQAPAENQAYYHDQPDRRDDFQQEPSKHHQQQYAAPPGSASPVYGYDQPPNTRDYNMDLGHTNRWEPYGPITYSPNSRPNMVYQYPNNATLMTSVNDNMGLAVFACLCCFWPLGLMAICKSCEVKTAKAANRLADAKSYAETSRTYSRWSIGVGCIAMFVLFVIIIFGPKQSG